MKKGLMSRHALSTALAACAIALFVIGHVLLVFRPEENIEIPGWALAALIPKVLCRFAAGAWANELYASDWLVLLSLVFVPVFCLGMAGFLLTAAWRPRTSGLMAALSGLCATASAMELGSWPVRWDALGPGYWVWLSSMGLLCLAGLCKLMPVKNRTAAVGD